MQVDFDWISGITFGIESGCSYEMDDNGNIANDVEPTETITVSLGVVRLEIYFNGSD